MPVPPCPLAFLHTGWSQTQDTTDLEECYQEGKSIMPAALLPSCGLCYSPKNDLRNSPGCKATFDALVEGLTAHVS